MRLTALVTLTLFCVPVLGTAAEPGTRPNVILILSDDVGYGDITCYGATRVKTPHIDRLASTGIRFTDGHTPAATCTPTRYSLLTGEYPWRKKGTGVLSGVANLIIEPTQATLPGMMKKAGYATGVVGKWHLGLGKGMIDWNKEIKPSPNEVGFDYHFIIPATGDRTPCVFVENRHVVGLDPRDPIQVSYGKKVGSDPTGKDNPELLTVQKPSHGHDQTIINGISRIGYMSGGKAARWVDENIADTITGKAVKFIEGHKDQPFFLYFATHDIHVPRVPHKRFRGTSQCGIRGDAIQQLDSCVGQILETLDRLKLADNTLVIFTSDNGPVVDDGYQDGAVKDLNGHTPAGPLRGGKYSLFEGGHRVPFLVRWPAKVKPAVSDKLVCQVDLFASLAHLVGQKLGDDEAPDSFDLLPALLGAAEARDRPYLVNAANGQAIRKGKWKYIPSGKGPARLQNTNIESGVASTGRLYDLSTDLGERTDVANQHPALVKDLDALLQKVKGAKRSRP